VRMLQEPIIPQGLITPAGYNAAARYEPSKRRLTWPNGAVATCFSAEEPNRLRGPQHDAAWCDELAAWRHAEAWDMLMLGLRLGADPRCVITTTPKPIRLIRQLLGDRGAVVMKLIPPFERFRPKPNVGSSVRPAILIRSVYGARWCLRRSFPTAASRCS